MRRSALFTVLIPLAGLLAVGGVTPAAPPHGPHGPGLDGGPMIERLARQLELTEAQQASLREVLEPHHNEAAAAAERLDEAHRSLEQAIHAESFDETAVRDAAAGVAEIQAGMAVERARIFQQLRQILTPEQLERFGDMRRHRRGPHERHPGGHGGSHGR